MPRALHLALPAAALAFLLHAPLLHAQAQDDPFGARNEESSVEAPEAPASAPMRMVAPITGKPIEAEAVQKTENAPPGRKTFVWHMHEYRDSEGRTRVEAHTGSFPAWITVTDPVAHKRYRWREDLKAVTETDLPATYVPRRPEKPLPADAPVMEGHAVLDQKFTNKQNPELYTETWYAPDIMYSVKRLSHNPKFGDITTTWSHFKEVEPKPKLFLPPGQK